LKTLFPQKPSNVSVTNSTSTIGLQLLSLWLLKVILRCGSNGVTNIKPEHQTTGNTHVIWSDESSFIAVPYIRKGLRLENTQGRLQSRMPSSNTETWGRFCDGLGSNIMVQYSTGPIITLHGRITAREYIDNLGNQVHTMIQT
jgi:hypothetical protein